MAEQAPKTNNNNKNNINSILQDVKSAQASARESREANKRSDGAAAAAAAAARPGNAATNRKSIFQSLMPSIFKPDPSKSASTTSVTSANSGTGTNVRRRWGLNASGNSAKTPMTRFSPETRTSTSDNEANYRRAYKGGPNRSHEDNLVLLSLNDIFQNRPVFVTLYLLKFVRLLAIAGALYLASRTFQSRYVNSVFVNNESPPNLMTFVLIFVVIEAIFMSLVLFIVYLVSRNVADVGEGSALDIVSLFMFDYMASSFVIIVIALLLAIVVMKKKYFRYRTDGLRAIRSLQEMILHVSLVALVFPYFSLTGGMSVD
jgi:hypothetical protein